MRIVKKTPRSLRFINNYEWLEISRFPKWMCALSFPNIFESFLAHLSRRLKWAFLITMFSLSVVVVVVVVNFSYFHLLQKHRANFNQTWHKGSLGKGDSSLLIFFLLIIALCKCVHWLELFLRWALWPMGL